MVIDESTLARILTLIAARPNARRRPRPGDVPGPFDLWFDGGAMRASEGSTLYQLGGGVKVTRAAGERFDLTIELPGGGRVRVLAE